MQGSYGLRSHLRVQSPPKPSACWQKSPFCGSGSEVCTFLLGISHGPFPATRRSPQPCALTGDLLQASPASCGTTSLGQAHRRNRLLRDRNCIRKTSPALYCNTITGMLSWSQPRIRGREQCWCVHQGGGAGPPHGSACHSFCFHRCHQTSGMERLSLHALKVSLT